MGSKLDKTTLKATLDGKAVKLKPIKDGDLTTVTYLVPGDGVWMQVNVSFSATNGNSHEMSFFGNPPPTPAPFDETKTQIALPLPVPPGIDGIIDLAGGESWAWAGGASG